MKSWMTVEDAAKRVGKSTDTIYRWARGGHIRILNGLIPEAQLLKTEKMMRQRKGRPRALESEPAKPITELEERAMLIYARRLWDQLPELERARLRLAASIAIGGGGES